MAVRSGTDLDSSARRQRFEDLVSAFPLSHFPLFSAMLGAQTMSQVSRQASGPELSRGFRFFLIATVGIISFGLLAIVLKRSPAKDPVAAPSTAGLAEPAATEEAPNNAVATSAPM